MEIAELIRKGKKSEAWDKACGFIDLKIEDCMRIQRSLLMEQLDLLKRSELGKFVLNGANPQTVQEFKTMVPLTTYDDYAPYLLNKREQALPVKPVVWQYTSGKSAEYEYRWVPVTAEQISDVEPLLFALTFFAGCKQRYDIPVKPHDKVLYGMAPPPYATGTMARAFPREMFDFLPPIEQAEVMSFEDRMQLSFEMALCEGLDIGFALSSVAVAIGDRFKKKGNNKQLKSWLKKPRALPRLAGGLIKSRIAGRQLLPKDLWKLKGLITFGIDSSIYREKIKETWGTEPLEFYGCTEAVMVAMQTWDRNSMTLIPHLNFLEFISEDDSIRSRQEPAFQPPTRLLDELTPGNYELVITSFKGGPFVRYRLGHMVKVTALRNEQLDIDIPQIDFIGRVDDQIDIAGFTRLSEKVIWQAIENSGIGYVDWTARKEVNGAPALNLLIELNGDVVNVEQAAETIHEALKKLDTPYAELESFTGLKPLKLTLLPQNAFSSYTRRQRSMGADLTQLKPPHINPTRQMVESLLNPQTEAVSAR